ncbi:MAG: chemotaxis protein CheW, partial [bacterium]
MSIDDFSLTELFRVEARSQVARLTDGLIALEEGVSPEQLEELMRAAHSLKGAARIVGHASAVRVAHELEECFVSAQEGRLTLTPERIDILLRGVDVLAATTVSEPDGETSPAAEIVLDAAVDALRTLATATTPDVASNNGDAAPVAAPAAAPVAADEATSIGEVHSERMLSLAGEALVASRVLLAHSESDAIVRRADRNIDRALDEVRAALGNGNEEAERALGVLRRALTEHVGRRKERAAALDAIGQRVSDVVSHLYEAVLDARMRPFGDGVAGMPRMLRDTARELGRDVRFVLLGDATPVDREVMRRLEAPLGHLVRNAVDHGIEPPPERASQGKPERGTIRVEARHAGGRLLVSVEDDGRGIDLDGVRGRIVQRGLADQAAAEVMSETELLAFLFLPGFTLRDEVTAISGRGVGLDAVHTAVREIGGDVRVARAATGGTRFEMQLPLTLSVVRALVVEIAGESYAFPLARVHRLLRVQREEISSVEGRQHFALDDRHVGLVWAHQLLGVTTPGLEDSAAVVVVGDHDTALGVVVDRLVGEQELVLRGMDARLGKVQDVGGAALLGDGSPTLVLDVDDLLRTASTLVAGGGLETLRPDVAATRESRKRVLVVDDSLTVRELERKMIEGQGYAVDVAVDGMEAWNIVRKGHYDLV